MVYLTTKHRYSMFAADLSKVHHMKLCLGIMTFELLRNRGNCFTSNTQLLHIAGKADPEHTTSERVHQSLLVDELLNAYTQMPIERVFGVLVCMLCARALHALSTLSRSRLNM
jgi:hypothetical protein